MNFTRLQNMASRLLLAGWHELNALQHLWHFTKHGWHVVAGCDGSVAFTRSWQNETTDERRD